jgi:3-dehydrosphinganine reductase
MPERKHNAYAFAVQCHKRQAGDCQQHRMQRLCWRVLQHLRITLIMKYYSSALITGGSSGIGLALAEALARQGVDLCLLARDQTKLQAAQDELIKIKARNDQRIDTISCDIRDYNLLSNELEQLTKSFGIPDLVINSAGVTYPGYFQALDVETFHWLMDINYFGTVHVLKHLVPKMVKRGSGQIVNISSQAGFLGVFGYSAYGASKYAVRGLSDVLRAELKPMGIQVSIVFPPDTQTPQLDFETPLKPIETKEIASSAKVLTAEEVAAATLKGVNQGKYIIIPGFEGKIFFRLTNLLGNLTYPLMDFLVRKAQKNKKK